jgi:hypothetical protein
MIVSFASAPASACPGSNRKQAPAVADQAAQADTNQAVAAVQTGSSECAYSRGSHQQCAGMSFGGKLLASSLPAGLLAFGLGWATGGRRKRKNSDQA